MGVNMCQHGCERVSTWVSTCVNKGVNRLRKKFASGLRRRSHAVPATNVSHGWGHAHTKLLVVEQLLRRVFGNRQGAPRRLVFICVLCMCTRVVKPSRREMAYVSHIGKHVQRCILVFGEHTDHRIRTIGARKVRCVGCLYLLGGPVATLDLPISPKLTTEEHRNGRTRMQQ